jgi:hypothetical protein
LEHFPQAKLFDVSRHTLNPLRTINHKQARDFATAVYTASPEGKDTLTVRNGRRALTRLLLDGPKRLDKLSRTNEDPGVLEALATVDDILLSPVLKRVLCSPSNFSFRGAVIAKLDRAVLGDFDAFLLGQILIGQSKGQVIVPDFGFYGRDTTLVRQNRLTAGVHFLAELSPQLRNAALLIEDKIGQHCLPRDADTLAHFRGFIPGTTEHSDFIREVIS